MENLLQTPLRGFLTSHLAQLIWVAVATAVAAILIALIVKRLKKPAHPELRGRVRRALAEDAEIYLVLLICVLWVSLHLTGVLNEGQYIQDALIIALGAFSFAILRFLHRLSDRERPRVDEILLDDYPESYLPDLQRAKELWISGTNLRRHFPDRKGMIEEIVRNGGTLHVIIAKPESPASEMGALQEYGYSYKTDEMQKAFSNDINQKLMVIQEIKKIAPTRVTILQLDFPIYFGLDGIDINSSSGVIYVRFYPIAAQDRPILVLRPHETRWFDFYRRQLLAITGEFCRATLDFVPEIFTLAEKLSPDKLSPDSLKHIGFLRPYTRAEYRQFVTVAEYFYVFRIEGRIVGFVLAHTSDRLSCFASDEVYSRIAVSKGGSSFIVVRQVAVDPDFVGRGYGRYLYEQLSQKIRSFNSRDDTAMAFIWEKPLNNEASANFHKALGWHRVDEHKGLQKGGDVGIWEVKLF
jgi:GNAT superfamily N-acetyltransferase